MNTSEIQSFIDETIYDFNTIEYSLGYGRLKETIPVMQQILKRIQSFNEGSFDQSFWDKDFDGKSKIGDLSNRIKELAQQQEPIVESDLEGIRYQRFISVLRSCVYEKIYQLRQRIKSPFRKKIEITLISFSTVIFILCLTLLVLSMFFQHDWGLRGDFYQGQNFDKHISVGHKRTINFNNYLDMNPLIPYEHSSARWQGSLIIPKDGKYTFFLVVDDGARLYIDGQILIDEWQDNNAREFSNAVLLRKGEHSIRLEYYNDRFQSILRLYWDKGGKKVIIPAKYLRYRG